jgi:hypothetical protein
MLFKSNYSGLLSTRLLGFAGACGASLAFGIDGVRGGLRPPRTPSIPTGELPQAARNPEELLCLPLWIPYATMVSITACLLIIERTR